MASEGQRCHAGRDKGNEGGKSEIERYRVKEEEEEDQGPASLSRTAERERKWVELVS